MNILTFAASAVIVLATSGAALSQSNQGTAGNGGNTGSNNCPDGTTMLTDPQSQKCRSESGVQFNGMSGVEAMPAVNDYTGSTSAPAEGNETRYQ